MGLWEYRDICMESKFWENLIGLLSLLYTAMGSEAQKGRRPVHSHIVRESRSPEFMPRVFPLLLLSLKSDCAEKMGGLGVCCGQGAE